MSAQADPGPILLCYDGSESAGRAIRTAAALSLRGSALVCHSWLGLSHVMLHGGYDPLPTALAASVEDLDELDRQAGQRVAEEGAKLAREAGFEQVEARAVKQETKAWRAIVGMAASESAQVTVLGAHGRSGVGRALLGSVSTAVLTHSHSPVLVVPDGTPEPLESDSLLVCFDGSEGAQRAVEAAGRLFPRRAVSVLTLWEPWVALAPVVAGMSVPAYSATDIDKVAQERSEELAAAGASVAEKAGLVPEPIRVEVGTGPLWKAVLDTAAQREAGAIVMGSRGMTGISAALGSVSHGVVHHSRLPVLVVPPEG